VFSLSCRARVYCTTIRVGTDAARSWDERDGRTTRFFAKRPARLYQFVRACISLNSRTGVARRSGSRAPVAYFVFVIRESRDSVSGGMGKPTIIIAARRNTRDVNRWDAALSSLTRGNFVTFPPYPCPPPGGRGRRIFGREEPLQLRFCFRAST